MVIPVIQLGNVAAYLDSLDDDEEAVVRPIVANIHLGNHELDIKKLRHPIFELRISNHRFLFFQIQSFIYVVRAFRKKSRKTPGYELENALAAYKIIEKL